jgi:tetratricopeptide (TPR) repeat protein
VGGQAGARGYLVQALICALEALADDGQWTALALEPNLNVDQIDLIWHYDSSTKVVQIRSSQNQIGVSDVKAWALALKKSIQATHYELRLIGPISARVAHLDSFDSVRIPTPQPLHLDGLIAQACHRLDSYLRSRGQPSLTAAVRELVVHGLVAKLAAYSTDGKPVYRDAFDTMLRQWVFEIERTVADGSVTQCIPPRAQQLPPPPGDFTGRQAEFDALMTVLSCAPTNVTVRGMPGVGKTTFALAVCDRLVERYPDGQFFFDLQGTRKQPLTHLDAMRHIIHSLRPNSPIPPDTQELAGLYRSLIRDKRILVLLDDARDADQVEPLVAGSGSLLVVTSRQHFTLPDMAAVNLSPLQPKEAEALLLRIAPRIGETCSDIAALTSGLPLALRLAASALSERHDVSPSDYARRLADEQTRFELVDASVSLSVDLLSSPLRQMFLQLSVFPFDFDLAAAIALWGREADEVNDNIGHLLRYSLIGYDTEARRYYLHDLIWRYTVAHCDESQQGASRTTMSLYYLAVAKTAEHLYKQGSDEMNMGLALFDRELPNIDQGFSHSATNMYRSREAAKTCIDYVVGTPLCRDLRQGPAYQLVWLSAAKEAAIHLEDVEAMVPIFGNLGRVLAKMGRLDDALQCHNDVRDMARTLDIPKLEAHACLGAGWVWRLMNKPDHAVEQFRACVELARKSGARWLELNGLNNLAALSFESGHLEEAKQFAEDAMNGFMELGDQRGAARAMGNLGGILVNSSDPQLAVEILEHGVGIARELRDVELGVTILGHMAEAYARNKRFEEAIDSLETRINLGRTTGDQKAVIDSIGDLAVLRARVGDSELAEAHFCEARRLIEDQDDRPQQGHLLAKEAEVALIVGDESRAIDLLSQRILAAQETDDKYGEAWAKAKLGMLLARKGKMDQAIELLEKAYQYFARAGNEGAKAIADEIARLRSRTDSDTST